MSRDIPLNYEDLAKVRKYANFAAKVSCIQAIKTGSLALLWL